MPDPLPPVSAFRADGTLRDGTPVCVRAIQPDDKTRLLAGFERLSPKSIYRRFFSAVSTLTAENLRYFTELDFVDHVGLAVTVGADANETFIAVGRFIRDKVKRDEAEVALIVADEYQHRGAATLLLDHLTTLARRLALRRFVALVQADNHEMLEVFQRFGLPHQIRLESGVTHISIELA